MKKLLLVFLLGNISIFGSARFDSLITAGIHQIYNIKFEEAESTFSIIKSEYPKHPAGKFFDAMILWWKILLDFDNREYDDEFINKIDIVVDYCDELLEEDPNNIDALFFKGGALGFRGRLYAFRKSWFDAAMDGKDALPIVYQAYEANPNNVDVQLGFGIYNYYAAAIPKRFPFVEPFMFMFPEGNITEGLKQLEYASEHGKYSSIEATYTLVTIYLNFERDGYRAEPYAEKLRYMFPDNPSFHRYYAKLFIVGNDYAMADSIYGEIIEKVHDGALGYSSWMEREAYYYKGVYAFNERNTKLGLEYFSKTLEISKQIEKDRGDNKSGFYVKALLYLGNLYDTAGKRQKALACYEEILDIDEYVNSHDDAEKYQEKPFHW